VHLDLLKNLTLSTPAVDVKKKSSPAIGVDTESRQLSRIPWKLALALVILTVLLFANTVNQYFLLDDFEVLSSAKYNTFLHVLLGYDTILEHRFFRPLPMFFTWLVYKLFGAAPAPFHAMSLLLYCGTAIVGANLVYLLHKNLKLAAVFAVLFLVFPNHAEVVNWPAITFTSWAALWYLLSMNSFAYYRLTALRRFLMLSLMFFILGIFSKESAYTLPAALVVFDWFLSKTRGLKYSPIRQIPVYALYFVLLILSILVTRTSLKIGAGYMTAQGENLLSLYLNNIFVLFSDLLRMNLRVWKYLLAPIAPQIPFADLLALFILLFFIASLAVFLWRRQIALSAVMFSFLFVSISALPMLGTFRFFTITPWIRFLYLPSIASCYLLSLVLCGFINIRKSSMVQAAIVAAAILPLAGLTKYYDSQWILAQQENKTVIDNIVDAVNKLPQHSRIYVEGVPWTKGGIPRIDCTLPGAIALYFDRTRIQAALHFLPAIRVLSLDRENYHEEEPWNYYRMSLNDACEVDVHPQRITPEPGPPVVLKWDFLQTSAKTLLEPKNEMYVLQTARTKPPFFFVDGPWTLLWLPPVYPKQSIKYVTLEVMLAEKKEKFDICRLFWTSEDDPVISGAKSIGFFVVADGKYHEYTVPLYRNGFTLTDPGITRFALRPSQQKGALFSVKKMSVQYY
jgi:hypothetical protein